MASGDWAPDPREQKAPPCLTKLRCPQCGHAIEYAPGDAGAARLAMVSHLTRQHELTLAQLLLDFPELERATLSYFRFRQPAVPFTRETETYL